jgi:carbon-monoxide dehydrogenase medium subunit
VFRVKAMEDALSARFAPAALSGITIPAADLMSDIHFSAEYRANAAAVLARRAVKAMA